MNTRRLDKCIKRLLRHFNNIGSPIQFPGFVKVTSFNFEGYNVFPTGLLECERLIDQIIVSGKSSFSPVGESWQDKLESHREYECSITGTKIDMIYSDYSINMYRTYIKYPDSIQRMAAKIGYYAYGFYYFTGSDNPEESIHDFRKTSLPEWEDYMKSQRI